MGAVFLINAPWIFPVLWYTVARAAPAPAIARPPPPSPARLRHIVRVWIDPRSREKIHVPARTL